MPGRAATTIVGVVGARPNFMKIAPVMAALQAEPNPLPTCLVHTGQHYDADMKGSFFDQLGIPEPDIDLGVGSGSHAAQTAEIMLRFEPVLDKVPAAAVLVVGDVNSTVACALVAAKKGVPVIHVEAGLRSFDRSMPEEINRVLTDQVSDLLFITEKQAQVNLLREGVDEKRIHFVGNVMIDSLQRNLDRAVPPESTFKQMGVDAARFLDEEKGFGLLTLHRPSNVDDPKTLRGLLGVFEEISERLPIVFPLHPRTKARIDAAGIENGRVLRLPPLGYLEMLGLMSQARLVLTDSGGIQEETTALGVPCLTLRENTERPITVEEGTNRVIGSDPGRIQAAVEEILSVSPKKASVPALWDGRAAERIKAVLVRWLEEKRESN